MIIYWNICVCLYIYVKHYLETTDFYQVKYLLIYVLRSYWIIRSSVWLSGYQRTHNFNLFFFTESKKLILHISLKGIQPIPIAFETLSSSFKTCVDVFLLIFSSTFPLSVTRSVIFSYGVNWSCKRAGGSSNRCQGQLPLMQINETMPWQGNPEDQSNQKSSWKAFARSLLGIIHSEWTLGNKK